MIRRNLTRTVKGGVETTHITGTPATDTLAFVLATSDKFYLGFKKPFACRYFALATANVNTSVLSAKYWNGTAWVAVDDLVDQTDGFTKSGFVSWTNPGDWEKTTVSPVADVELYWLELAVSANLSAGTALQAVLNLFCDDFLMRAYYPSIAGGTRYLPTGRTDFLEQYVAAKDMVVTRLRELRAIDDESQILDVTSVATAAVHAAAYIVLFPRTKNLEQREKAAEILEAFNAEVKNVRVDFDVDNSGVIDEVTEDERPPLTFRMRG